MVSELQVTDLDRSLAFWVDLLGFEIAYRRHDEKFVYLERPDGAQVMLEQRKGRFETAPMALPFGRGVMMQVYVDDLEPIRAALAAAGWPLYLAPREIWRRTGEREGGQREMFVQDPDGYLLMIAQMIGERAVGSETPA
ncbi:MAG: bleomycin resistance protein [Acetobacteraceae bacterium]